jgi:hypothetical protein
VIEPDEIVSGEWAEWYRLTPLERWRESEKIWEHDDQAYWRPLKAELERCVISV